MASLSNAGEIAKLYEFLPVDDTNIRILHILPGRKQDDIKVNMRIIQLDPDVEFEALSYTWGESTEHRHILVNGRYKVHITDNLYNALLHLRRRRGNRILWVDQLCINQASLPERGQQVAIMGSIYKAACRVNVWLGMARRSRSVNFLPKLTRWLKDLHEVGLLGESLTSSSQSYHGLLHACLNIDEAIEQAIDSTNPCWHNRAWAMQEFALAKQVYFWCGSTWFLYDEAALIHLNIAVGYKLTGFCNRVTTQLERTFRSPLVRLERWGSREEPIQGTLHIIDVYGILKNLYVTEATNPIDLVYSFLGMLNEEEAAIIGTDYSLKPCEAFARATYASIKFRKSFDILTFVPWASITSELPSWAVDFSFGSRYDVKEVPEDDFRRRAPDSFMPIQGRGGAQLAMLDMTNTLLSVSAAPLGTVIDILCLRRGDHVSELESKDFWDFVHHNVPLLDESDCNHTWDGFAEVMGMIAPRRCRMWTTLSDTYGALFHEKMSKVLLYQKNWSFSDKTAPRHVSNLIREVCKLWTSLAVAPRRLYRGDDEISSAEERSEDCLHTGFEPLVNYLAARDRGLMLFVTSSGLIGLAPDTVSKGDSLVLLASQRPFVCLRETGVDSEFCGQVWIWGIEGREVSANWDQLDMTWKIYTIR